jgi:hypothetical protein
MQNEAKVKLGNFAAEPDAALCGASQRRAAENAKRTQLPKRQRFPSLREGTSRPRDRMRRFAAHSIAATRKCKTKPRDLGDRNVSGAHEAPRSA